MITVKTSMNILIKTTKKFLLNTILKEGEYLTTIYSFF